MRAALHGAVRCGGKKRYRAAVHGREDDQTFSELVFQRVGKRTHLVRAHALDLLREDPEVADGLGGSEDVFRFLRRDLRLQFFIFRLRALEFILQGADAVFEFLRRGLKLSRGLLELVLKPLVIG